MTTDGLEGHKGSRVQGVDPDADHNHPEVYGKETFQTFLPSPSSIQARKQTSHNLQAFELLPVKVKLVHLEGHLL